MTGKLTFRWGWQKEAFDGALSLPLSVSVSTPPSFSLSLSSLPALKRKKQTLVCKFPWRIAGDKELWFSCSEAIKQGEEIPLSPKFMDQLNIMKQAMY